MAAPPVYAGRRVAVFGLGGTIAMTATAQGGVTPTLTADQLMGAVPELAQTGITVDAVDFRRLPGASLSIADIGALSAAIRAKVPDLDALPTAVIEAVTTGTPRPSRSALLV